MVNAVAAPPKKTPHHRRREEVYRLLTEAAKTIDNPTYDELIEYVKARTGKGCRRKLISEWKKKRLNNVIPLPATPALQAVTTEKVTPELPAKINEPTNIIPLRQEPLNRAAAAPTTITPLEQLTNAAPTTTTKAKVRKPSLLEKLAALSKSSLATLGLAAILWTASTSSEKVETANADEPAVIAQVSPNKEISPKKKSTTDGPRKIKITVNLSKPEDLRVKQGDEVMKGQVISDRTLQREQLLATKKQLEIQIQSNSLPIAQPLQPNFTAQEIMLEAAKTRVEQIKQQPLNDPGFQFKDRWLQEVFEPEKIAAANQQKQRIDELSLSESIKVDITLAQLEQSKAQYQANLNQYQQSIERQRYDLISLHNQLTDVEKQLQSVSEVRSPYSGTIRKIKFQGQEDNVLTAEISLDVKTEEE